MSKKRVKTICIYNNKGGVGKSTVAINLCQTLADMGKKVIAIDNDSQNSFSFLCNLPVFESGAIDDPKNGHKDLGWLIADYYWHGNKPTYQAVKKTIVTPKYHKSVRDPNNSMHWIEAEKNFGFDLIPGFNKDLSLTEMTFMARSNDYYILRPNNRVKSREALKMVVDVLKAYYDYEYIIIDCAPNLGLNSIQALIAGNELIIPVTPDFLSSAGLSNIIGNLIDLHQIIPSFNVLGVLFNMYSSTKADDRLIADIEEYGREMDLRIFSTRLPRVNQMRRLSSEDGISVLTNEKPFRMFNARMKRLANEIMDIEEEIDAKGE